MRHSDISNMAIKVKDLFLLLHAIKIIEHLRIIKFETRVGESSINSSQNTRKVMTVTFTANSNDTRTETFAHGTWMTRSIRYRFAYGFRRIRQIRCIEVESRSHTPSGFSTHIVTHHRFLRET